MPTLTRALVTYMPAGWGRDVMTHARVGKEKTVSSSSGRLQVQQGNLAVSNIEDVDGESPATTTAAAEPSCLTSSSCWLLQNRLARGWGPCATKLDGTRYGLRGYTPCRRSRLGRCRRKPQPWQVGTALRLSSSISWADRPAWPKSTQLALKTCVAHLLCDLVDHRPHTLIPHVWRALSE